MWAYTEGSTRSSYYETFKPVHGAGLIQPKRANDTNSRKTTVIRSPVQAVPRLMWLVASLSPPRPKFAPI
jgi:hypothetical protein